MRNQKTHVPDDVYQWMLNRWEKLMASHELGRVDFQLDDSEAETEADFRYVGPVSADAIKKANGWSSKVRNRTITTFKNWRELSGGFHREQMHVPILDIDFEVAIMPSSTNGHWHLVLNKPMGEAQYMEFLRDLAQHGIIERGYWCASDRRKASWLRTPWAPKGSDLHKEVELEMKGIKPDLEPETPDNTDNGNRIF